MLMNHNPAGVLAIFDRLGGWEILLILMAMLLLFGGKKLPELARGLARGIRTFKDELNGVKKSLESETPPEPPKADQAPQAPDQQKIDV